VKLHRRTKCCKKLELAEGDMVFCLSRVYSADEEPINYTTTYLPIKLFPGIEKYDYSDVSLYSTLEEKYGATITRATRTIEAVSAHDEVAEQLDVEDGAAILLFKSTTMGIVGGKEQPIETFKCFYRCDKFKFYINQVK
jgi:GntR family transcriptional regulator